MFGSTHSSLCVTYRNVQSPWWPLVVRPRSQTTCSRDFLFAFHRNLYDLQVKASCTSSVPSLFEVVGCEHRITLCHVKYSWLLVGQVWKASHRAIKKKKKKIVLIPCSATVPLAAVDLVLLLCLTGVLEWTGRWKMPAFKTRVKSHSSKSLSAPS